MVSLRGTDFSGPRTVEEAAQTVLVVEVPVRQGADALDVLFGDELAQCVDVHDAGDAEHEQVVVLLRHVGEVPYAVAGDGDADASLVSESVEILKRLWETRSMSNHRGFIDEDVRVALLEGVLAEAVKLCLKTAPPR